MVAMVLLAIALLGLAASFPYAMYGVVASGFQTDGDPPRPGGDRAREGRRLREHREPELRRVAGHLPTDCTAAGLPHGDGVRRVLRAASPSSPAAPTSDDHDDHRRRGVQRHRSRTRSGERRSRRSGRTDGQDAMSRHGAARCATRAGVTLTELVVTLALFAIVMAGVVGPGARRRRPTSSAPSRRRSSRTSGPPSTSWSARSGRPAGTPPSARSTTRRPRPRTAMAPR